MQDDLVDNDLNQRLFGPQPDRPLELPGVEGRDRFRTIADQDSPASVLSAPSGPRLSKADEARAQALIQELAKLIRNTNITASLPAHSVPMLWSDPIDLSARYTLPAAVTAYATVLSYKVPPGRWARINGYGVDVVGGAYTYDGSILWRIQVNGVDVPSLADWGQHRGTLSIPRETFIVVPEDQTVTFQVSRAVAAGGDSEVDMVLKGWTWRLRRNAEGTKASITAF